MVREGNPPLNDYLRIDAALAGAVERLKLASESPRLDAELLLARALDVQRSYLFAHPDDELDPDAVARFEAAVAQRADGMPLAYITGEKEFWSMPLIVSPATLVPRPETELLVEQALIRIPRKAAWQVADLGTGSGAIALAIAKERPLCGVTATDISAAALAVAQENARQLMLSNVEFLEGDWTGPLAGRAFDIVVSNPPYVANEDPRLKSLRHEPGAALSAGNDGLDAIRHLAATVGAILKPAGWLLLEHGLDHADRVAGILAAAGWADVTAVNDLEGRPRVTAATRG